jgi:predicted LPLAT superfamily acyltransferase
LAEAGIPFSLVVNHEVYTQEGANFKTGFDRFKSSSSQSFGLINAEESDALFKMLRAFKSGQNLLIYVDGNTGTGTKNTNNLVVDFMQGRLSVRKGVAVLASVLKCPIYPVSCIRPALDEVHFKMHKVLFGHEAADREAFVRQSMQQLYNNLASLLKKDPFQWECWLYLHQFLVLLKADVPPVQIKIKELGDARLWGLFNIGDEHFALHKPSFSSFDITALTREIKRKVH